ncbi:MAG: endonuclease/exonuclease/phosphatase family protein [Luminiphilus sp.]|nr:endonuclease/exonuclease/phosphatase family protein [Luminiphilus sp.]
MCAAMCANYWACLVHAAENQSAQGLPMVVNADHSDDCAQTLSLARHTDHTGGLETPFSLLNWNVEKAQNTNLITEFAEFARHSDLIFLQEAVPIRKAETVIEQSLFAAFVRGYVQNEIETGVLTLARASHLVHCHLLATEPWLRTPKATSITLYPLSNSNDTLLTVNLHAINFSFGIKAYSAQLDAAAKLIRLHQGPVIFGGDLNTWSKRRQHALDQLADELALIPVRFSPDHRTRRFGNPLDHLYVRGLTWQSAETRAVSTSDHNPLFAHFKPSNP